MTEDLLVAEGSKTDKYKKLLPQLKVLCKGESNTIANLANVSAAIKQTFGYYWVGFYFVDGNELVLGPFQGAIACTRIKKGMGVCGKAWEENATILVPNVNEFQGHIACSSLSKSEIVVPLIKENEVIGVLDVDHDEFDTFDEVDQLYLTKICEWLAPLL